MTEPSPTSLPANPIAVLRRFARPRKAAEERCELCAAAIGHAHAHLLEPATGQLLCACEPCAILFGSQATRYRRVPHRIQRWSDFAISDQQWESLGVPIALAFFFYSTPQQTIVSMYPSPGGATRATLPAEPWELLCQENRRLGQLQPDVEALLVNRLRGARDYYRMPIDRCFELVGMIRTHWRGLSGGLEMWKKVDEFFQALQARSAGESAHA